MSLMSSAKLSVPFPVKVYGLFVFVIRLSMIL